jgi:Right handed beta helix region
VDNLDRRSLIAGASLLGAAALVRSARAGDLNPPQGAISPTGRSLHDVEPRTPIQSLQGNSDFLYVITQPGSYFLTGDIPVPQGKRAIFVSAAPGTVSIDGEGFRIYGIGGQGAVSCATPGCDYLDISDMHISSMSGDAIDSGGARCMECYDLHIDSCANGIIARCSALIEACHVERCSACGILWQKTATDPTIFVCDDCECRACGQHGLSVVGDWSAGDSTICVSDCDCVGNQQDGMRMVFVAGSSGTASSVACSVSDCRCMSNGGHGGRHSNVGSQGAAGARVTMQIADCVCSNNAIGGMRCFGMSVDMMDCACSDNGGHGVSLDTCTGSCECCACCRNGGAGLSLSSCVRCSVSECATHSNTAQGVLCDSSCSSVCVTECDSSGNANGFTIQSSSCSCLWNTASSNGQNYAFDPASRMVVVSADELATNTCPHCNYSL